MVFGKRQQSVEDKNVYFSTSTQEYYDNIDKDQIDPISVESAAEFFHLPKKLFINYHKSLGSKVQNDDNEEDKSNMNQNTLESVNDVNKEDITISVDEVINNFTITKEEYANKKFVFEILTGNLKNHEQHFHLATKINQITPMLCIQKYKKGRLQPSFEQELKFEIEFPYEYCFANNYISQFTVYNKDFMVISRLYTSSFGVINLDQESMSCKFYGIDCMSSMVTCVHWTKDNKTLIAGYQTGSIAIWDIKPSDRCQLITRDNKGEVTKTPAIDFKLRTLHSASPSDNSEILCIDANVDLGMFIAVTKSNLYTIHSISNGQCLNWIKMSPSSRMLHGVRLSKNGYFIVAYGFRDKLDESEKDKQKDASDK